jgi:hypothetical protein
MININVGCFIVSNSKSAILTERSRAVSNQVLKAAILWVQDSKQNKPLK